MQSGPQRWEYPSPLCKRKRSQPNMRASRKRFVRRGQPQTIRRRPVGDGTAVGHYMHNASGRAAMKEALAEQRRKQNCLCADCGRFMEWSNCKFKLRAFPDGVENEAVHKRC